MYISRLYSVLAAVLIALQLTNAIAVPAEGPELVARAPWQKSHLGTRHQAIAYDEFPVFRYNSGPAFFRNDIPQTLPRGFFNDEAYNQLPEFPTRLNQLTLFGTRKWRGNQVYRYQNTYGTWLQNRFHPIPINDWTW